MTGNIEGYIAIGRIVRLHGTEGWVRVLVYSGVPERFDSVDVVFVKTPAGLEGVIISERKIQNGILMLRLRGVDDREAAAGYLKKELFVPEAEKVELPEDYFFIHDIIGLQVFDTEGKSVGKVEAVMQMGANDVYVVRNAGKEMLIPAVEAFVKTVDVKNGKMVVRLWEGM